MFSAVTCSRQHLYPVSKSFLQRLPQCRSFTTTPTRLVTPRNQPKPILLPGAAGIPENPPLPVLQNTRQAALRRRRDPFRVGVLAVKKGMTAIFDRKGTRIPCTVLQIDRCQVMANKTVSDHGYWAVQVGAGERSASNVTKPMRGHFSACNVSPKKHVEEFRIRDERGLMEPGTVLHADWFRKGQMVDLRAKCKGKGFAGGMKRHGFSGQPASHGNSLMHRAMGSAGQSQGGGSRVLPGKRMAGRMGGQYVTIPLVKVLDIDRDLNTIVVKGCVPGPNQAIVAIQDARLSHPPDITVASYVESLAQLDATAKGAAKGAAKALKSTAVETKQQPSIAT